MPTGISCGVSTTLATISKTSKAVAPLMIESDISWLVSALHHRCMTCGTISPIKPMIPENATAVAVASEADTSNIVLARVMFKLLEQEHNKKSSIFLLE